MSNRRRPRSIVKKLRGRGLFSEQRDGTKFAPDAKVNGVTITAPDDPDKEIIKRVPAYMGDIKTNPDAPLIGETIIYSDGSYDLIVDPNADPEAVRQFEIVLGYTNIQQGMTLTGELGYHGVEVDQDGSPEQG